MLTDVADMTPQRNADLQSIAINESQLIQATITQPNQSPKS